MIEEKVCGFKARGACRIIVGDLTLNLRANRLWVVDLTSRSSSYRYYYGPLSAGRDGRAMGCRELTT